MENVGGLGALKGPVAPNAAAKPELAEGERSFKEILQDSIANVNNLQAEADLMLQKVNNGEADPADLMIAAKKSQIAFEALMQIRNKLVGAFEEIQRMRI